LTGRGGSVPKQAKDWVLDSSRVVHVEKLTDGSQPGLMRMLLWHLTALQLRIPAWAEISMAFDVDVSWVEAMVDVDIRSGVGRGQKSREGKR
jgi:hypothetical protein